MSAQKHEFQMEMTCDGCSGAAKRVLSKLEDVEEKNIEIDMEKQRVFVTSSLGSEVLLSTLKKTGKPVSYIGTV